MYSKESAQLPIQSLEVLSVIRDYFPTLTSVQQQQELLVL